MASFVAVPLYRGDFVGVLFPSDGRGYPTLHFDRGVFAERFSPSDGLADSHTGPVQVSACRIRAHIPNLLVASY